MTLVLADRVKETSTTTGTGTYTLAGAVSGFETFGSIGNGNTTYYACTLGADFEVGIGTYTSSGTTLARTTILQSSNSDNAVDWGAGTKTLFCTQPAEKAVFRDASGHIIALDGRNLTNVDAATLDSIDSGSFLRSDAADTKTSGDLTFNDDVKAIFGTSDDGLEIVHDGSNSRIKDVGTGSLLIGASFVGIQKADGSETAAKFFNDGAVELYHDNSKKIESTSSGATVTGTLVADGLDIARDTDAFAEIGEAHIGFVGHSNLAGFSHIDQNSTTNYSLIQDANGTTYLNGASGRNVRHRINNVEVMTMSDSGLDITGDLTVTSTDAGATENPTLDLYRNSSSPADSDVLGHINFTGENDADEKIVYAEIESVVSDVSDGSEDSKLNFRGMIGGSQQLYMSQQFGLNYFYRDILLYQRNLIFEGATADDHETTLTVTDPTADRTITLPDATGTVLLNTGDQSITGDLTLTSTDAGATENPTLDLYRNSASPADGDVLGHIDFSGENSASEKIVYAQINTDIADASDGTEDGRMDLAVISGGTQSNRICYAGQWSYPNQQP